MTAPPSALLEERLLALLKGRPAPRPLVLVEAADGALGERLAAGEIEARRLADCLAHDELLQRRVKAALDADRAPILLQDGSRIPLEQAERVLAEKEARQAFGPLRFLLEDRADEAEPAGHARAWLEERAALGPGAGPPDLTDLSAFLDATEDLGHACLEALATEGGVPPPSSPEALARGLELPHYPTPVDTARASLARVYERLAPLHRRRVSRTAAPRALAGVVLAQDEGTVRWLVAPCLRPRRYLEVLEGGARAVIAALYASNAGAAPGPEPLADEQALAGLAAALAMAAGAGAPEAERREREALDRRLRCTRLLLTRARAALALAWVESGPDPEGFESALFETLGQIDPGSLREATRLPWPGAYWPGGPGARLWARVKAELAGAAFHRQLRERWDLAWPAQAELAHQLAAAPGPAAGLAALQLPPPASSGEGPGPGGLVGWVSEML